MRTTLDLDEDVLASAKEIARRQGTTAGRVLSELARRALTQPALPDDSATRAQTGFLGFEPFPQRGKVVTNDIIDRLRDESEY